MNNGKQQAFPSTRKYIDGNTEVINIQFGLTKREYFAGLIMQGLIAKEGVFIDTDISSKKAIEVADELLKQLEK